ncbi:hypothetical protein BD769DRAFT_137532 [Suillus cothurnatus]|nr:hypothetical protein BD769DRAFT_137532 [Suillus cothurnatus]
MITSVSCAVPLPSLYNCFRGHLPVRLVVPAIESALDLVTIQASSQLRSTISSFLFRSLLAVRMARCSIGFLVAVAWIMTITEAVVNVVADFWFRVWTLGCNNWSRNLYNGQPPRRSQQNRHEHGCCLRLIHGFLHMLRRAYGKISPRHRHLRLLRYFARQGRAVRVIWLTRIY